MKISPDILVRKPNKNKKYIGRVIKIHDWIISIHVYQNIPYYLYANEESLSLRKLMRPKLLFLQKNESIKTCGTKNCDKS